MAQCTEKAKQFLEALLCLDLTQDSGERTFTPRQGMRTVFVGIFSKVNDVKINGESVTNFYPAFFNKNYGGFFNSLVFTCPPNGTITVDADWGFANKLPADLQRLLDNADKVVNKAYQVNSVKSKKVEDFSITYGDLSDDEEFLKQNAVTINKYSMCNIPYLLHTEVCYDRI